MQKQAYRTLLKGYKIILQKYAKEEEHDLK